MAFFALMMAFFTIICGITFCHHFKISDITFYYRNLIFTGTIESADWDSQENAKMWRKDLADTINATNGQLGIVVHREIIRQNMMLKQAKAMLELAKQEVQGIWNSTIRSTATSVKNKVMEMNAKVGERKGRLELPIVGGTRLRRISARTA